MKNLNLLFIACFLMIISLPFLFMDRKSTVSEKENRVLAVFPPILINDGKIDIANIRTVPQSLDKYINDRFGFRNSFVSLANMINRLLKIINGNVVIGKGGWLFYSNPDDGNNIFDFFKSNLFTDIEIVQFMENIEKRLEWCNNNNIQFIFLIAPNKHNVYPEYYPFDRPQGITRTQQIMEFLSEPLKGGVIYPLEYIIQNKTPDMPLYFETDTHWNMAGAYYAFDRLFNCMKEIFPQTNFNEIQFITDINYDSGGDIVPMSGFTRYGKRTIPDVRPLTGWESYYHYIKNEGTNGVIIIDNNNLSLPKALIFRDSFFSALEPFTSTQFSHAEYIWRWFNESEKQYILENKPDIIIWEVVERRISGIPYSSWN
jgi:hypothetical protein